VSANDPTGRDLDTGDNPAFEIIGTEPVELLDGELTFWLGDRVLTATTGSFVTGRRGTPHRFRVESAAATCLDLMTPAGR
jgi:uncharacterized cupin superfamily protein